MHTKFAAIAVDGMLLLPTCVRQTAHGYSPELCKRSRPVPQIMTFVFPKYFTPRKNYCPVSVTCNCTVEIEMHFSNTFKNKLTLLTKKS